MAILISGIFGGFAGKVGTVVGSLADTKQSVNSQLYVGLLRSSQ